jgi:hypothetical protein
MHQGYCGTAEAFAGVTQTMSNTETLQSSRTRQRELHVHTNFTDSHRHSKTRDGRANQRSNSIGEQRVRTTFGTEFAIVVPIKV